MSIGNLSSKIRKSREESSYSQKELGNLIGVSDKAVSAYEAGRAVPPINKLKKIADATNRPITYFSDDDSKDYSLEAKLAAIEKELIEVKRLLKNRQR